MSITIPPEVKLSEGGKYRNHLVSCYMDILQHIAWKDLNILNKKNSEIVLVCIQVDDKNWRDIVEQLMPDQDWQQVRDQGIDPVLYGSATWPLCEVLAERLPGSRDLLLKKPSEGLVKLFALAEGGCTVYEVTPKSVSAYNN